MKKLLILTIAVFSFQIMMSAQSPAAKSSTTPKMESTTKSKPKPEAGKMAPMDKGTSQATSSDKAAKSTKTKSTTEKSTTAKTDNEVHLKADGTPDKRYKSSKHLKADGTPDKRYSENKK